MIGIFGNYNNFKDRQQEGEKAAIFSSPTINKSFFIILESLNFCDYTFYFSKHIKYGDVKNWKFLWSESKKKPNVSNSEKTRELSLFDCCDNEKLKK